MKELEGFYNTIYGYIASGMLGLTLCAVSFGLMKLRVLNNAIKVFLFYTLAVLVYNLIEQGFVWSVSAHTKAWEPFLVMFDIKDTNFLNVISRLIDYVFLGWFYAIVFEGAVGVYVKRGSMVLFVVAVLVYFYIDGFRSYGNVNSLMNRMYLVALPVLYLWLLYRSQTMLNLWKNPYFLISLGLLIPNLFGLFLSLVGDKINQTDFVLFVKISLLRNAFTAIGLLLFCLAFRNARYAKFILTSKERIINT